MLYKKAESPSGGQEWDAPKYSADDDRDTRMARSRLEITAAKTSKLNNGHSLFQDTFFFCDVKNVGDLHGTGCIYVEMVVDSNTGCAFAKVFPAKNAMNAVEILSSRVLPYFKHFGLRIREIHTRKTPEFFGLAPVHPYETFLASCHIQHLSTNEPGKPYNYACVQFYRSLRENFFRQALRKKFTISLPELQVDLDAFMENYNACSGNV